MKIFLCDCVKLQADRLSVCVLSRLVDNQVPLEVKALCVGHLVHDLEAQFGKDPLWVDARHTGKVIFTFMLPGNLNWSEMNFFFKYCCRSFFFFKKKGVGKRTKLFNCRIWFHTPLFHVSQQKMASFLEYFSNNKYRPRILITVSQALLPNPNPWPWGKRQEHRRHKLICSQGPPWPGGGRSAAYWTPHLLGHRSGQPSLGGWTLVWACRRGRRDNVLYGQSSPLHSQFLYLKGKTIILNLWNRGDNGTWISIMESHRGLTRPRMFAWEIGLLVVLVIKHQACLRRSQIWYVMGSVCGWNIK